MPALDALGIIAEDLEASLSFYRLLGLDIPSDAAEQGHVDVQLVDGFRLMFDSVDVVRSFSDYEPPSGGRGMGLAFSCDDPADVDRVFAVVAAAGHRVKLEPFDAFWGQRYATVLDPDGNPVDLYAPLD